MIKRESQNKNMVPLRNFFLSYYEIFGNQKIKFFTEILADNIRIFEKFFFNFKSRK